MSQDVKKSSWFGINYLTKSKGFFRIYLSQQSDYQFKESVGGKRRAKIITNGAISSPQFDYVIFSGHITS